MVCAAIGVVLAGSELLEAASEANDTGGACGGGELVGGVGVGRIPANRPAEGWGTPAVSNGCAGEDGTPTP